MKDPFVICPFLHVINIQPGSHFQPLSLALPGFNPAHGDDTGLSSTQYLLQILYLRVVGALPPSAILVSGAVNSVMRLSLKAMDLRANG